MSEFAQMKPVAIRRYVVEYYLDNLKGISVSEVAKHFQTSAAFVRRCCDEAGMEYVAIDGWTGSNYAGRSRVIETVEPSKAMLAKMVQDARMACETSAQVVQHLQRKAGRA